MMRNIQFAKFDATLEIIGINPFVFVPDEILTDLFRQAEKNRGPIPVKGTINGQEYQQTLVKFTGHWRLYINNEMLENSPRRIGETVHMTVVFDPADRALQPHSKLVQAFEENQSAKAIFDGLTKSRQQEIIRYLARLKSEESLNRNIERVMAFLHGNARFVGRDKP